MGQMPLVSFLLAWSPLFLIILLAVGFKWSALKLGTAGLIYTCLLSLFWFKTGFKVVLLSALDGAVTTLPATLVVFFAIILSVLLIESGALTRIVAWIGSGLKDPWQRTLGLSAGVGNFLEGSGLVAEPVAAPMLTASGVAPYKAAVLSIQGYAGLFSLELAGAVMAVLVAASGLDIYILSWDSALISILPTFFLIFTIPWFMGEASALKGRVWLFLYTGVVLNLVTVLLVLLGGFPVSAMTAGLVFLALLMIRGRKGLKVQGGLWRDLMPFAFIIFALLAVNLFPPVRRLTFEGVVLPLQVIPIHTIRLRPAFDAYTYLFLAFILGLLVLRPGLKRGAKIAARGLWQGLLVAIVMGLFGAVGQVVAYSGYAPDFASLDPTRNMAHILAQGVSRYSGHIYPLFAPLLGWAGTVITGYGTASVLLFGGLQVTTAQLIGLPPTLLAGSLAVGGGVGSISSPFKLAIAASVCGARGQEGLALRKTIPLGIAAALVTGGWTMLLQFLSDM